MKRTKPLVGLLGLLVGLVAAVAGRKRWRTLAGRISSALPGGNGRRAALPASVADRAPTAEPSVPMAAVSTEAAAAGPQPSPTEPTAGEDEAAALRADEPSSETPAQPADALAAADLPPAGRTEAAATAFGASESSAPEGEETVVFVGAMPASEQPVGMAAPDQAAEAEIDAVLDELATAATAHDPATVQRRFGPNAVPSGAGGDCPPEHPVKGNTNSKIYHLPGQPSYGATMAEVCFADAAAAEAAGFRARKSGGGQARR